MTKKNNVTLIRIKFNYYVLLYTHTHTHRRGESFQRFSLKYFSSLFLIMIFFNACSENEIIDFEDGQNLIQPQLLEVKNGRLVFENKLSLKSKVEDLKTKPKSEVLKEIENLIGDGFLPKRSLVEIDETLYRNFYSSSNNAPLANDFTGSVFEEDFDDFEEIISDDEFATLINNEGEIQVADTIYKYTENGLYFVHESKIQKLYDYLNDVGTNPIKLSPVTSIPNSTELTSMCIVESNQPQVKIIEPDIKYFSVGTCSTTELGISDPNNEANSSTVFDVENFISNLPSCDKRVSSIGRLFGKSVSCTSKFDSDHRIKTKFWDQDYFIYQSIGVVVKHQTKKVWIWWTTNTDELRLGINNAYFEYNLSTFTGSQIPQNPAETLYIFDNKLYTDKGLFIKSVLGDPVFSVPFDSKFSVILDFRKLGFTSLVDALKIDPTLKLLTADKFNKDVQRLIWDQAKTFLRNLNGTEPQELSIVGYLPQKVVVSHINKSKKGTNIKKIKKVFDRSFRLKFGLAETSSGSFKFKPFEVPDDFIDYQNVVIDIYGVGKRDEVWKGSRLLFD